MDVKANPSIQKGMPFKHYHGRTGVIYNVTKRAVGVEVNKPVRVLRWKLVWWLGLGGGLWDRSRQVMDVLFMSCITHDDGF